MATRKPAGSNVRKLQSDKPAPISLNLDTLERENGVEVPFVAVIGGKTLVFSDPAEQPWQDLMDLDDPEEFARMCLSEDDRGHFLEHPLEAWKMNELLRAFQAHYGLGDRGNASA